MQGFILGTVIHTASQDEMTCVIEKQTDEILTKAYREMLQGCLDHPQEWDWYAIWFIDRKDGSHVGDLCFKGLQPDGSVEIGYGIAEESQGHGYATEAVDAVTAWALKQSGVCRVEAETDPANMASQRVLEKCGFSHPGSLAKKVPASVKHVDQFPFCCPSPS